MPKIEGTKLNQTEYMIKARQQGHTQAVVKRIQDHLDNDEVFEALATKDPQFILARLNLEGKYDVVLAAHFVKDVDGIEQLSNAFSVVKIDTRSMDLKRLNEPNPYPDSYNPSNSKIAPTADGIKL